MDKGNEKSVIRVCKLWGKNISYKQKAWVDQLSSVNQSVSSVNQSVSSVNQSVSSFNQIAERARVSIKRAADFCNRAVEEVWA